MKSENLNTQLSLIEFVCDCGKEIKGSVFTIKNNYDFTCGCGVRHQGTITQYLKEKFPHGFVQCAECGVYYDSREVYKASHTAPDYEWVGECGHARLKWKTAPKDQGVGK